MSDYNPSAYPPFAVTVDLVVLNVRDRRLQVLLIERAQSPEQGKFALPGGFARIDEDLEHAAYRELEEETGLRRGDVKLEQLGAYGDPGRDERMRVVSVAWVAFDRVDRPPRGGGDAKSAGWYSINALPDDLAFDHATILRDAIARLRSGVEDVRVAASFLPEPFTISELRHVYEVVWGVDLDRSNFQRRVMQLVNDRQLQSQKAESPGRVNSLTSRGTRITVSLSEEARRSPFVRARIEPPRDLSHAGTATPTPAPRSGSPVQIDHGTECANVEEFIDLLRSWATAGTDPDEEVRVPGSFKNHYIKVPIGGVPCFLSGDTKRKGVLTFLRILDEEGAHFSVVANKNGDHDRIAIGPHKRLVPTFYLYAMEKQHGPARLI